MFRSEATMFRGGSRALALAFFIALGACGGEHSKQGSDAGAIGKPDSCTASCSDRCDVPDGCGGQCDCAGAQVCADNRCVADECGGCAQSEMCVGGRCVCSPQCGADSACKDDGCGGLCPCPDDLVQNADGNFVPRDQCHDTCDGASWTCGELCGVTCGDACESGQRCALGSCECKPTCDGTRCDDGCGGTCECAQGTVCDASRACVEPAGCDDTCASTGAACGEVCGVSCGTCGDGQSCVSGACQEATSCSGCSLALSLVDRRVVDGRLRSVTLALDYNPTDLEPRPRLADVRVTVPDGATLSTVLAGAALQEAGKELFVDSTTGDPWKLRTDGSYQFLAYKASNVERFANGRVLTMTFTLDTAGPVEFALVRRLQTFAPAEADAALQSSAYETAVVVSR